MGPNSKYAKHLEFAMNAALVLAWLTCAVMFVALLVYRPVQVPDRDYALFGVIAFLPLAWFGRKWIAKVLGAQ